MIGLTGRAAIYAGLLALASAPAASQSSTIVVTADRDYPEMPLSAHIKAQASPGPAVLMSNGTATMAQARRVGGQTEVSWMCPAMAKGDVMTYRLNLRPPNRDSIWPSVAVRRRGANVDIAVGGKPFTTYDCTTGPNKPYFYPVLGPEGIHVTRGWPVEQRPEDKSKDHPHHRGLWFTHGDVNGVDYWSEEAKTGKTVTTRIDQLESGPIYGRFSAHTDWIAPDGKKVAEDVRDVTVWEVSSGRLMDLDVTVKAVGAPLTFGDTKEGSLGIRLADSMRLAGGDGHIVMSTGARDQATWGKRADWVDYFGTVEGKTLGVAIMDGPGNPRHPTYWHVRDYGLFAANPFGAHDFEKAPPHAGDLTIPAGGAVTFRYRIYIHSGTTDDAHVAEAWAAYVHGPSVEVK